MTQTKKVNNYDLEERTYQFVQKSSFLELRKKFSSIHREILIIVLVIWSLVFACPVACEALV